MADEKSSEHKTSSEESKEETKEEHVEPEKHAEEKETHEEKPEHHEEKETHEEKPKEEKQKITPEEFRKFLKHLMRVSKKQKKRSKARAALSKHIEKLKEKPIAKLTDKVKFRKGLKGLNDKVSAVLDTERQLLGIEKQDLEIVKMLKDEIIGLKKKLMTTETERDKQLKENKEAVTDLNELLSSLKGRLGGFIDKKTERDKKIRALEEKIRATPVRKHEVIAAKKQLEQLERKYKQLSRKAHPKERLSALKERIDNLKGKIIAEV